MSRFIALSLLAVAITGCRPAAQEKTPIELSPDVPAMVEGNNTFALQFYARLAKESNGNLIVSPHSISTALAMTYAGAAGDTKQQMSDVLHFSVPDEKLHPAFGSFNKWLNARGTTNYQFYTANRLWGQKKYEFREACLKTTREVYGAELKRLDFQKDSEAARVTINSWVAERTQSKIKDLIPPKGLNDLTRLVLTNAVYFKGRWKSRFDTGSTYSRSFYLSKSRKVHVPTMVQTSKFRYAQLEDLRILEMPYVGGDLSMVILLPDEIDGLRNLESSLSSAKLKDWLSRLVERKTKVNLPRFTFTNQFSLRETLKKMGMPLAFDVLKADFSAMSSDKPLYITAVFHKAFVDVNENGTEAAATAVVIESKSEQMKTPPPLFRADHPFLFLILERQTRAILFLGRVVNPAQ